MKSQMVSVIMNCLNGDRYLSEAIESVYAQTYPNWEIVFWDNASIDDSSKIAKSYGDRVRYFRNDTTYRLGKVRNLAVSQAQGEYIAIYWMLMTFGSPINSNGKYLYLRLTLKLDWFSTTLSYLMRMETEAITSSRLRRIVVMYSRPCSGIILSLR